MEKRDTITLESKIHALEELLTVSETSFLAEAKKLEQANKQLYEEMNEHKRLEEKLHKSEEEYRTLFESSRDAIMLLDSSGFLDCNKTTLDLFGFSIKEQFIGKQPVELSSATQPDGKDSLTASMEHIENVHRDGLDFFEWIHKRQNGTIFYAEVLLSRMKYQSKLVLQATVRDITARKQAEQELLKAHKDRIEMANNILHDIGNALTGISSCAQVTQLERSWIEVKLLSQLRELFLSIEKELTGLLGEEKEKTLISFIEVLTSSLDKRNTNYIDFCEKISTAVGHISAVLDLQRYYLKEKSIPSATVIDIKKIIEDALIILSSNLQKRNIKVKTSTDGKETKISGDQTRLMQLFLNIIKNIYEAFDALEPAANRKLEINIVSDMKKQEVIIVFTDNGIGFSPETGGKLFERGFTTKLTGLGIGLQECQSIVESHSGTISIESKGERRGASTIIKLPLLIN